MIRFFALCLAFCLLFPAATAVAADRIAVRAGNHDSYGRLVLEWPRQPNCSTRQNGATLILNCAQGGAISLPANAATGNRLRRVEMQSRDPLVIKLTATSGRKITAARDGRMIIIDIADSGQKPPTPGRPLPELAQKPTPPSPIEKPEKPTAMPEIGAVEAAKPAEASPTETTATATPEQPPEASAPAAEPITIAATIRLDPSAPTPAAIFGRGGALYMVIGRPNMATAPLVEGARAGEVRRYARKTVGEATVYTMPLPAGLFPHVRLDGQVWEVQLKNAPIAPGKAQLSIGKRSLTIAFPGAAPPVEFEDPLVHDRLIAVMNKTGDARLNHLSQLIQVEFLPAGQGLAIRPLDDSLSVGLAGDEVTLTVAGGLLVSDEQDRAQAIASVPAVVDLNAGETTEPDNGPTRMFDLKAWAKSPADDPRPGEQALMAAIISAPKVDKADGYLALARHMFASGFMQEARGALRRAGELRPSLLETPEAIALSGAIEALAGDPDKALADLSTAAIADQPEAALWRGVARARKGDWSAAFADFKTGSFILPTYPRPLLEPLGLLAAESALDAHDIKRAQPIIDELAKAPSGIRLDQSALQFLRGEVFHQKEQPEKALAEWEKARQGRNSLYRVKAELASVDLALKEKKITLKEAIERLERLRFAWRGDALELAILARLGDYQMQSGDYRSGWATFRGAAAYYPATPQAMAMTERISTSFAELFKDGGKQLNPVEAYGLYEEFKSLAPEGEAGDQMIEKLADRLVGIGAIGKGADLLGRLLDHTSGPARHKLITRLATLRILDGDPQAAIDLLDRTGDPSLTADQINTRRLLRARAMADNREPKQALALIEHQAGTDAARLARDIAWASKDWPAAAAALDRLIDQSPGGIGLSDEKAKLVMNRAIALSLAGDKAAMAKLVETYGTDMALSKQANNFRLITRPQGPKGLADLKALMSDTAETSLFSDFLNGLKGGSEAAPPKP